MKTKKGDRMAAFMLEDLDSTLEVVAFPETFRNYFQYIENDRMVLVRGKLEAGDDSAPSNDIAELPLRHDGRTAIAGGTRTVSLP